MTSDTVKVANISGLGMFAARWYADGRKFDLYTYGNTVFISWESPQALNGYVSTMLSSPERFGWHGAPSGGRDWMRFARTVAASFTEKGD